MKKLSDRILEFLSHQVDRPMSSSDISRELELGEKPGKKIHTALNRLVSSGQIVRARKDKYIMAAPADLVTGKLDMLRSGNAFLAPASGGDEVFISSRDLGTAMPGDTVVARLSSEKSRREGDSQQGKVIKLLERGRHDIVGTLSTTGKFLYVVPVDSRYSKDFYVPDKCGAKPGDRVVIRFTGWLNKHVSPEAEIIEVIGPASDPSLDTVAIVRHHGFRTEFPSEVLREAESVSALMEKPDDRLDLRKKFILTIDPNTARDFDDALSLEKDADGNRVLGVHIADVSHFIVKGSALDKEAKERGTSVYLPDLVIPMIPEQLSNGVCSLKPDEDRFAFSVFMTLDRSGKVIATEFAKTIIRSRLRLTYKQALAILQDEHLPEIKVEGTRRMLKDLHALAQDFRAERFANYALNLDIPECEVVLDETGLMTGVRLVENDISHQLIEECMVAANEAVARELSNRGIPLISRFHDKPQPGKIEDLQANLASMGLKPGDLSKPANVAAFLVKIEKEPLAHSIKVAVLRSMQRAVYTSKDRGHFGLAKAHYAHFTSPIRRYPDLVLHRQLADIVRFGKKNTYRKDQLEAIAQSACETESEADDAERAILEIKKYRFLQQQIEADKPEVYDAIISQASNMGLFVELLDLQVQGLIHMSQISGRFVRFNRESMSLSDGKKRYAVGDRVKVYVCNVDLQKRRIDFSLYGVKQEGKSSSQRRQSGRGQPRKQRSGKSRNEQSGSQEPRSKRDGGRSSRKPSKKKR